ncbi:hypothetical protein AMTRI_Chr12g270820 [Amborella trichopoda]
MFTAINAHLDHARNNRENGESSHTGKTHMGLFLNGKDPTSWVCRADQFFEFHLTQEEDGVPLGSFNLEGDPQLWYLLMKEEGGIASWDDVKSSFHAGYGPTNSKIFLVISQSCCKLGLYKNIRPNLSIY